MRIDSFLVDRHITVDEATALASPPTDGSDVQSEQQRLREVLASPDVTFEDGARARIEALLSGPVTETPPVVKPIPASQLFVGDAPLTLTLNADFTTLFQKKLTDGRTKGEACTVDIDGRSIPARVKTRGQSSIGTLPEPKLKLHFERDDRKNTAFVADANVDIGVQGGDNDTDRMGRVLRPEAPPREAATYALLHEMGVCVPQVRVAHITYVDTASGDVRQQPAFLCEDTDRVAARVYGKLGVKVGNIGGADARTDVRARVKTSDVIRLHLANMLIGNQDWRFATSGATNGANTGATCIAGSDLHNTKLVFQPDPRSETTGDGVPVACDFDLSLMVMQSNYDAYYLNALHPIDDAADVAALRANFPGPVFDDTVRDVLARQPAMLARLAQYPIDAGSLAFMTARTNAFCATLSNVLPPPG